MEKIVTYHEIEKIEYRFTKYEILVALIEKYKIPLSTDYEFDLWKADANTVLTSDATLVMKYTADMTKEDHNNS